MSLKWLVQLSYFMDDRNLSLSAALSVFVLSTKGEDVKGAPLTS